MIYQKMTLKLLPSAELDLERLMEDPSNSRIVKDIAKALKFMEKDLRHTSLNTHEYIHFKGLNGEKVFCAYAQQNTPKAYRILWYYGPERQTVSIFAIIPHL